MTPSFFLPPTTIPTGRRIQSSDVKASIFSCRVNGSARKPLRLWCPCRGNIVTPTFLTHDRPSACRNTRNARNMTNQRVWNVASVHANIFFLEIEELGCAMYLEYRWIAACIEEECSLSGGAWKARKRNTKGGQKPSFSSKMMRRSKRWLVVDIAFRSSSVS